jgi:anti-sigma factor RsiW
MEHASEHQAVIKRYVLGQLSDAEREVVELRLLTDSDYFTESLLVEDEITEDLISGALPIQDQTSAEKAFLADPERQKKLNLTNAIKKYLAQSPERRWEATLKEANHNRQMLCSIQANDWLGLRLLKISASDPRATGVIAGRFQLDDSVVRLLFLQLCEVELVEERMNDIFSCTNKGTEFLQRLEDCADFV